MIDPVPIDHASELYQLIPHVDDLVEPSSEQIAFPSSAPSSVASLPSARCDDGIMARDLSQNEFASFPGFNPGKLAISKTLNPPKIESRSLMGLGRFSQTTSNTAIPASSSFACALPQPYSRTAAVLVDEFNAGGFESFPHRVKGQAPGFVSARLKLAHCHDTDKRCFSQIGLAPPQ